MKAEYDLAVVDTACEPTNDGRHVRVYKREQGKRSLYRVKVFLEGRDLPYVASVTYMLHHTFKHRARTVRRTIRNQNCALSIWTWGVFRVQAIVEFKSGQSITMSHDLGYDQEIQEIDRSSLKYVMVHPSLHENARGWANTVSWARGATVALSTIVAALLMVSLADRLVNRWSESSREPAAQDTAVEALMDASNASEIDSPTSSTVFRDCAECPELVVVPAGEFVMGPPTADGRLTDDMELGHKVTLENPLAVGIYEVTRREFAGFVEASGHIPGQSCGILRDDVWRTEPGLAWSSPGFAQDDGHPVACVSWWDANAYVEWLSRETGKSYRLLSESEWEYAARAGTSNRRYWDDASEQCRYANAGDRSAPCLDGYPNTAPVGSYEPNEFGLYDVLGNVWEWTKDCWHEGYEGAPTDGRAWDESGDCTLRVVRGASWLNPPRYLDAFLRNSVSNGYRDSTVGFRVSRELDQEERGMVNRRVGS